MSNIEVVKLGENIGARIDGVAVGPLDAETASAVNAALLEHKVVFFRGQHHLDDEAQHAFGESLGIPTTPHPTLSFDGQLALPIDSETGTRAVRWHTDVTFVDRPPKVSILRAVELPPYGGATMWASTAAAYQQLPACLQLLAESLWAMHSNEFDYSQTDPERVADLARTSDQLKSRSFEVHHPVVRVHPETGERALMLGNFVKRILGVDSNESQALFRIFQDRITANHNTIRWHWSPGDVAMWDNRTTQHCGVWDYGSHRRTMHRVTLAGDIPRGVTGEQSRVIAGDASDYSVIDSPERVEALT